MNAFMSSLVTVLGGALFGFGLALSGMVSPEVVLSFLLGQDLGLMLTCIGRIEAEHGVRLFNQGQPVANRWASFDHFKGAA